MAFTCDSGNENARNSNKRNLTTIGGRVAKYWNVLNMFSVCTAVATSTSMDEEALNEHFEVFEVNLNKEQYMISNHECQEKSKEEGEEKKRIEVCLRKYMGKRRSMKPKTLWQSCDGLDCVLAFSRLKGKSLHYIHFEINLRTFWWIFSFFWSLIIPIKLFFQKNSLIGIIRLENVPNLNKSYQEEAHETKGTRFGPEGKRLEKCGFKRPDKSWLMALRAIKQNIIVLFFIICSIGEVQCIGLDADNPDQGIFLETSSLSGLSGAKTQGVRLKTKEKLPSRAIPPESGSEAIYQCKSRILWSFVRVSGADNPDQGDFFEKSTLSGLSGAKTEGFRLKTKENLLLKAIPEEAEENVGNANILAYKGGSPKQPNLVVFADGGSPKRTKFCCFRIRWVPSFTFAGKIQLTLPFWCGFGTLGLIYGGNAAWTCPPPRFDISPPPSPPSFTFDGGIPPTIHIWW